MTMLSELPLVSQVTKYLDGCSCARASKEEVAAIKAELDQKDSAIERLETEIRQKDLEKDNLMTMQKVLQEQISQIRADLEAQSEEQQSMVSEITPYNARPAPAAKPPAKAVAKRVTAPEPEPQPGATPEERAAAITRMQARQRGKLERRQTEERVGQGEMAGQKRSKKAKEQDLAAQRMQARVRGGADRKAVEARKAAGDLPGQPRLAVDLGDGGGDAGDFEGEEESVDSDYDYDDSAFVDLGAELLSGQLKLAKVYGQEEPPAAEGELEWELRYFLLYAVRTYVSSKYGGTVPLVLQHRGTVQRAIAAACSSYYPSTELLCSTPPGQEDGPLRQHRKRRAQWRPRAGAHGEHAQRGEGARRRHLRAQGRQQGLPAQARAARRGPHAHVDFSDLRAAPVTRSGSASTTGDASMAA